MPEWSVLACEASYTNQLLVCPEQHYGARWHIFTADSPVGPVRAAIPPQRLVGQSRYGSLDSLVRGLAANPVGASEPAGSLRSTGRHASMNLMCISANLVSRYYSLRSDSRRTGSCDSGTGVGLASRVSLECVHERHVGSVRTWRNWQTR